MRYSAPFKVFTITSVSCLLGGMSSAIVMVVPRWGVSGSAGWGSWLAERRVVILCDRLQSLGECYTTSELSINTWRVSALGSARVRDIQRQFFRDFDFTKSLVAIPLVSRGGT